LQEEAMDLILWRHADAEPGQPDDARALTTKGEKQARRMAQWLHDRLPAHAKIHVSPARRAQQTAAALAHHAGRSVHTDDALSTSATADGVLAAVGWAHGRGTVVVVGHQPTLGEVASRIMTGEVREWSVRKGGIVWLTQREDELHPALRAVLDPDLL
jgi:phosphohistidine phosphatase